MWRNKKAVIFDMDGTLIDSMWIWKDIDIEYLGSFGISLPEDLQVSIEGMSFTETAEYFLKRFALPRTVSEIEADWNRMAMHRYAHDIPLKAGARRFLDTLKKSGLKLGIATSNSRELAVAALEANGALDLFDSIHTSLEVSRGKPAPDIYLLSAETLGTAPEDCLVFEDVPMGILAAKAAGMQVCGVWDRYSADREDQIREMADFYIRDFDELFANEGEQA